jgi:hypothetical protein
VRYTTFIITVAALIGAATLLASQSKDLTVPETFIELPKSENVMVLAVKTGRLPDGAELHLTLEDGTIVGTIAPFGQTSAAAAEQSHLVLVQLKDLPAGSVQIIPFLLHNAVRRKATSDEFMGLQTVGIKE